MQILWVLVGYDWDADETCQRGGSLGVVGGGGGGMISWETGLAVVCRWWLAGAS